MVVIKVDEGSNDILGRVLKTGSFQESVSLRGSISKFLDDLSFFNELGLLDRINQFLLEW